MITTIADIARRRLIKKVRFVGIVPSNNFGRHFGMNDTCGFGIRICVNINNCFVLTRHVERITLDYVRNSTKQLSIAGLMSIRKLSTKREIYFI